ncbi:MAG: hypothetical protein JEZ11_27870 [Desulfobacterales bacterium]|nr:hypothetical protein [Desulfobacterales bacterium]
MAKRKKIDETSLLKMIDDGTPQKEIMEKFGFKNSSQLKVAYANALITAGKVPGLKKSVATKAVDSTVSINNRGSLIIPKVLVDELGLGAGDTFTVRKSKAGLSLKKV